jgi:hypothetical protein
MRPYRGAHTHPATGNANSANRSTYTRSADGDSSNIEGEVSNPKKRQKLKYV